MSHFLHFVGSYPLLFTLTAQFFVLVQAWKSREKPMMAQALCMIVANGVASVALALRPRSPQQFLPDVLGSIAAIFLLAPAAVALQKMSAQRKKSDSNA